MMLHMIASVDISSTCRLRTTKLPILAGQVLQRLKCRRTLWQCLDNYKCIAKSNDISGNLEVDYKIHGFEDLHLHVAIGAQYTDGKQDETISKYSYSNNYFGYYGYDHAYKYSIEGKAFAEYAHKFGVHDIDIMAGAEQSHYHRTGYNYGTVSMST